MTAELPTLTDGTVTLTPRPGASRSRGSFTVATDDVSAGEVTITTYDDAGRLTWRLDEPQRGQGFATRAVRLVVDWAMTEVGQAGLGLRRVEAHAPAGDQKAIRVATRAGLRHEGVRRISPAVGAEEQEYVVLARLVSDPPLSEPRSFRTLLNSFLPRKRGIGQMLVRDSEDRVLLCQLTYKRDWDLPGGVVEVGESPRLGVARELSEELGVDLSAGELLLTDWLPPWSGWDDAICLVFDGGVRDASIVERMTYEAREIRGAEFCTPDQIAERCADFTARRIAAALERAHGRGSAYTESGRSPG